MAVEIWFSGVVGPVLSCCERRCRFAVPLYDVVSCNRLPGSFQGEWNTGADCRFQSGVRFLTGGTGWNFSDGACFFPVVEVAAEAEERRGIVAGVRAVRGGFGLGVVNENDRNICCFG